MGLKKRISKRARVLAPVDDRRRTPPPLRRSSRLQDLATADVGRDSKRARVVEHVDDRAPNPPPTRQSTRFQERSNTQLPDSRPVARLRAPSTSSKRKP